MRESIVAFRGDAFEPRVGVPLAANAVHDLRARGVRVDHFLDRGDVVLQVGVDADDRVTARGQHARQQRVLMSVIARQLDPVAVRVGGREPFDHVPRTVGRPVVHEIQRAVGRDCAGVHELREQRRQPRSGDGQRGLLVVARHDDRQARTATFHVAVPAARRSAGA